jgi:ferritin-like metal-binding protein YciE
MAMKKNALEKLFTDNLMDIYDAEHQVLEALPKMAEAAKSDALKKGFTQHLAQTRKQIERLEKVFETVNRQPRRKPCKGMQGLIEEGQHHMEELKEEPEALDAGLIASAQKVEHYEIAAYGTVKTYAEMLGNERAAKLLDETLSEEFDTDDKLTDLAVNQINLEAMK